MSLMAAIDTAVRLQLAKDKPGTAYTLETVVGSGLAFTEVTLGAFLESLAHRLRLDTPPLMYDWNSSRIDACLTSSLAVLIGRIASDTTPVGEAGR